MKILFTLRKKKRRGNKNNLWHKEILGVASGLHKQNKEKYLIKSTLCWHERESAAYNCSNSRNNESFILKAKVNFFFKLRQNKGLYI